MNRENIDTKKSSVFTYNGIEIYWLKHAGFKIKNKEGVIYIDPYHLSEKNEKADILFISHSHSDHLDESSIKAVLKPETIIICADECKAAISTMIQSVDIISLFPGNDYIFGHLKIHATPAYNLTKPFHPKEKLWLGFIIEIEHTKIYFAGDTDFLEELKSVECDIGLFPVAGIYAMDATEAANFANAIKPKVVSIPMHWGALLDDQNRLVGNEEDAKKFCELYQGPCQILSPIG
jgi:L-ascorbate metabolism protein UlaG (beta-lactamase superfamily)